jgi:hypothetical protein
MLSRVTAIPEPEFGDFASPVIARMAPRLVSWVWLKRAERVLLRNTDGEPMVLVDAAVTVDGDVTERLFARSDFGEDANGEDGQLAWWGGQTGLARRWPCWNSAPRDTRPKAARLTGSGWRGCYANLSTSPPSPQSAADGQSTPPGSAPNSVSSGLMSRPGGRGKVQRPDGAGKPNMR